MFTHVQSYWSTQSLKLNALTEKGGFYSLTTKPHGKRRQVPTSLKLYMFQHKQYKPQQEEGSCSLIMSNIEYIYTKWIMTVHRHATWFYIYHTRLQVQMRKQLQKEGISHINREYRIFQMTGMSKKLERKCHYCSKEIHAKSFSASEQICTDLIMPWSACWVVQFGK